MNTFIKKLWVLVALALPLLPAQSTVNAQNGNYIDESIYENLPFNMPKSAMIAALIICPTSTECLNVKKIVHQRNSGKTIERRRL